MEVTWSTIGPILRDGTTIEEDAVWGVVQQHGDFVLGAVRRVVGRATDVVARYDGHADEAVQEAFQWVVERLVRRVLNDPPGLPVSERDDGERGSAPRWFFTVCANLARDWLKAERRRIRRETEIPDHAPPSVEPVITFWDDANLRKLERLLARPERAGVPDTHVLAYLCLYRPEAVDREMIARAHAYTPSSGSRSGKPGLSRPIDESWDALCAWRDRHRDDPFTTAARAELAWVLRSDDPGPPETWRDRDLKAARTAAVTVGKWAIRCADVLTLPRR